MFICGQLVVCKQPALSFEFADGGDVLRDFETAQVLLLFVADGEVADVDEAVHEVDPELGHILPAGAEIAFPSTVRFTNLGASAIVSIFAILRRTRGSTGCPYPACLYAG